MGDINKFAQTLWWTSIQKLKGKLHITRNGVPSLTQKSKKEEDLTEPSLRKLQKIDPLNIGNKDPIHIGAFCIEKDRVVLTYNFDFNKIDET